jgi:hypothetical protein
MVARNVWFFVDATKAEHILTALYDGRHNVAFEANVEDETLTVTIDFDETLTVTEESGHAMLETLKVIACVDRILDKELITDALREWCQL